MNEQLKTELTPTKRHYIIMVLAILILLVGIVSIQAGNNSASNETALTEMTPPATPAGESGSRLTVWNIIKMTDWLFWPFTIMTAVGVMLIIYNVLREHQEKSRARRLMEFDIRPNLIRNVVQVINTTPSNRASRLFSKMIATFNKTNHAEPMGNEVNQFMNGERESFETFNRVVNFLSDSAGALGLLGTVWGIFMTFHSGKMDGPTILHGMSVALITTLVGLIISLFLNLGATYVFTLFNDQLKQITGKAEELRQALLLVEKRLNETAGTPAAEPAREIFAVKPQASAKRKQNVADRVEVAF